MGVAVEGKSVLVKITPVIVPAAYASGDQIGGVMELPGALDDSSGTGGVLSICVLDKASQNSALDLLLFSSSPVLSSTDNTPLDISDAEMEAKFIGRIKILTSDYTALAANSIAVVSQVAQLIHGIKDQSNGKGLSIFAVLQSRGAPTYASASDLVIKVGIIQD